MAARSIFPGSASATSEIIALKRAEGNRYLVTAGAGKTDRGRGGREGGESVRAAFYGLLRDDAIRTGGSGGAVLLTLSGRRGRGHRGGGEENSKRLESGSARVSFHDVLADDRGAELIEYVFTDRS